MKIRYFISLVFIFVVLVYICFVLGLDFYRWFIDLYAILVVIITPLIFMGLLHGWKNIKQAFSIISKKNNNKKDLLYAKFFFENYGKTVFLMAFIASMLSFIAMLKYELKEDFGPALALVVVSFLYASIINMLIIIPYKINIKKKIMEMEN